MAQKIADYKKEAEKFGIKGLIILTAYDVYSLMIGAIEGGSTYWYEIQNDDEVRKATPKLKGEPFVTRMLMAIKGGLTVKIADLENEGKIHEVNAESFAKAEKLMIEKHRYHLGCILKEEDDAITADVFFQLLVLGENLYG